MSNFNFSQSKYSQSQSVDSQYSQFYFKTLTEAQIPYELTITTSDIRNAGTNADVFVQIFGTDGTSSDKTSLVPEKSNRRDHFGRAKVDVFVVQSPNVGEIEKIRIGHDGTGIGSGWHLSKILVRLQLTSHAGDGLLKMKVTDVQRLTSFQLML